jgi:ferredoxin
MSDGQGGEVIPKNPRSRNIAEEPSHLVDEYLEGFKLLRGRKNVEERDRRDEMSHEVTPEERGSIRPQSVTGCLSSCRGVCPRVYRPHTAHRARHIYTA